MVVATVLLFLANTLLTHGARDRASRGREQLPQFAFFVSTVGRILGELLAFGFSVSLFYVTYSYASVRRLPWRTALLASTFSAVLFEIAKRLYGLYLTNLANLEGPRGDANIGAAVLFVLWVFSRRSCSCSAGWSPRPGSSARWSACRRTTSPRSRSSRCAS